MTESKSLVERLAGEAGFDTDDGGIGAPWLNDGESMDVRKLLEKFAELVAADLATAWQEANGFDKHGVGEFIRQRFGVGE